MLSRAGAAAVQLGGAPNDRSFEPRDDEPWLALVNDPEASRFTPGMWCLYLRQRLLQTALHHACEHRRDLLRSERAIGSIPLRNHCERQLHIPRMPNAAILGSISSLKTPAA
jgi:hypothetical protein